MKSDAENQMSNAMKYRSSTNATVILTVISIALAGWVLAWSDRVSLDFVGNYYAVVPWEGRSGEELVEWGVNAARIVVTRQHGAFFVETELFHACPVRVPGDLHINAYIREISSESKAFVDNQNHLRFLVGDGFGNYGHGILFQSGKDFVLDLRLDHEDADTGYRVSMLYSVYRLQRKPLGVRDEDGWW